ncbi:hypothetical protein ANANG_G00187470 [Anguilla anguilla]|uniref:Transmembrane protein 150A n=1 Tax=Anguilla anguilla TaxID=7936 RepID=A0A9D3RSD7_ANGAN|nr:hypothetical protein ANANG_G00187470 [Anguilla anguilla]
MTAWIVLPFSLAAFCITGIWIVYAMAVMNHHVCPVENWSYNVTCTEETAKQGFPKMCCTLQDIPLISKCGSFPPESCLFSLIGNVGAFMATTAGLTPVPCSLAVSMPWAWSWWATSRWTTPNRCTTWGGRGPPAGLLFVCLQCVLTYRVAVTALDHWMAHVRVALAVGAMVSLVLSGIFFIHVSFVLQHVAAICEWVFTVDILVFYGTFTYEFGTVTTDTMTAGLQSCRRHPHPHHHHHQGSGVVMGRAPGPCRSGGAPRA